MRRVLVTGANRGLGLGFVHQLLKRGDNVIACCRDPHAADALAELVRSHAGRLHLKSIDVADPESIATLAAEIEHEFDGLDLLINNAGKLVSGERFGKVTADALTSSLQTNAVGAFLLTQALAPLLGKAGAATVVNISSQMGSIARTESFRTPSYAISKAALNMVTVLLARAMAAQGVRVIAFHPGWMKTAMGGDSASLPPDQAAMGILHVVDGMKIEDSGTFVDYQGHPLPW